jgi:hypothetical protein
MYYLCPGCHRRCRGLVNVCLDCEFALESFRQLGYACGVHYGTEWGVAHIHLLSKYTLEPEFVQTPPTRATAFLSEEEEVDMFTAAAQLGIERGMRIARRLKTQFSKYILPACILEAGRRTGTATALLYFAQPKFQQRADVCALLDYNVFRVIREMVRGPRKPVTDSKRLQKDPVDLARADTADAEI